jgi:hypothetical protein
VGAYCGAATAAGRETGRGAGRGSEGIGGVTKSPVGGGRAGAGAGVSSTVEWCPVVQGGMERNSSKVRTRGLQHFQPRGRDVSVEKGSERGGQAA